MSDRPSPFRWGILGTGNIAAQFAADLQALPDHRLIAVASREADKAQTFCDRFGGTAVAGYDRLLGMPGLDGIYLSLPNMMHAEWTMQALAAGHHVLCEKPLATSRSEAEQMFAAARSASRLLVEAFMYRCHPQTIGVVEAIRRGDIGRLTHVRTSFIYRTNTIAGNIRFDPVLAGGALMDVGCYCLDFSMLLAGTEFAELHTVARKHERGVDIMASAAGVTANGVQATFVYGMDTQTDNAAVISGTEGFIHVAVPWKPKAETAGYTLARGIPPKQDLKPGEKAVAPSPHFIATPTSLPLYALEAQAFAQATRSTVDPFMTEACSLRLASALERARSSARAL